MRKSKIMSAPPNVHFYSIIYSIEDEIYYTSKIEGAKTTMERTSEIHNGASIDRNNEYSERIVKNGFEATKLMNLYGNSLSHEKLRKIWDVLTDRCCDNHDIKGTLYRSGTIYVGRHEGSNYKNIPNYMDKLINFYNSTLYDVAFIDAENKYNDCTPFIEYMLEAIAESYMLAER